jgi:hypothetical protein
MTRSGEALRLWHIHTRRWVAAAMILWSRLLAELYSCMATC